MSNPTVPPARDSAKMWNVLCHASALTGLIIPLGFILGPLVVWSLKRGEYPSVDTNGKEAANFQLSCLLYMLACFLVTAAVTFYLSSTTVIAIGHFFIGIIGLADIILIIIASIKVSKGNTFRYPLTIRLITTL